MKNKRIVDGVEISLDDGDPNTSNIEYEDETYAEKNDAIRIEWMKKQLRYYGYRFINKKGETEE